MKRSMHPEVWSSQTPSREAWEWYPLQTVRDGFQPYVMHFWIVGTTTNFELWWLILFACWKYFVLLAVTWSWDIFPWTCFPFNSDLHKKKNRKMVYIWFGTAWCQSTLLWLCVFYSFQSRKSHFHKSHVLYKEYHFTFSRSAEVTVWYVDIKQRGKSALFVGVSFHFPAWLGNCVRPKSAWGQTWLETLCLCD